MFQSPDFNVRYTKKERLLIEREIQKLTKLFEGISGMKRLPDAIFVTAVNHDDIAVKEAQKSGIKIFGIVDSNTDPDGIAYPIPCNDDATKAVEYVAQYMAAAVNEGKGSAPVKQEATPAEVAA
jgi:small subunit ribosomal protein S2